MFGWNLSYKSRHLETNTVLLADYDPPLSPTGHGERHSSVHVCLRLQLPALGSAWPPGPLAARPPSSSPPWPPSSTAPWPPSASPPWPSCAPPTRPSAPPVPSQQKLASHSPQRSRMILFIYISNYISNMLIKFTIHLFLYWYFMV